MADFFVPHVANAWRQIVVTGSSWVPDPSVTMQHGEAGGFRVRCELEGLAAYLKPTQKADDRHPRAANEKIVADLAFDVSIPAPPVVLYRRDGCPPDHEHRTCISLVAYPEVHEWGQLSGLPDGAARTIVIGALARSCAVVALDTWVDNTDRNNDRNGIVGIDPNAPSQAGFMFIDHANSLNHNLRWDKGGWRNMSEPPMPALLRKSVDRSVLRAAIDRIEAMPDDAIHEIVGRIPDDYMAPAHKSVVIEGLKGRRSLVRAVLTPSFGL